VILGASFDTVEENAAFAKKFTFPFPLLCDTDHALATMYGAADPESAYPRRISVLIDEDGAIAKVYDPVSAKTHATDVLADLG
jgi:peroxiredoxin Q/BCP